MAVQVLVATGANTGGHREILGDDVTCARRGLAFLRSLAPRGLSGMALVTSDAPAGLAAGVGASLPAGAWHRCRTQYESTLMNLTPKRSWGSAKGDAAPITASQPDAEEVHAQL